MRSSKRAAKRVLLGILSLILIAAWSLLSGEVPLTAAAVSQGSEVVSPALGATRNGKPSTPVQSAGSRSAVLEPAVEAGALGVLPEVRNQWTGYVVGPAGQLLGGARVSVPGWSARPCFSDSRGRFSVAVSGAAQQRFLHVRKAGFAPQLLPVPAFAGEAHDWGRIELKRGGSLTLVPMGQPGLGVSERVNVVVTPAVGNPFRQAMALDGDVGFQSAGSLGSLVRVEDLPEGRYSIAVGSQAGLQVVLPEVWIRAGQQRSLGPVDMGSGRLLAGRVTDEHDAPLAGAGITVELGSSGGRVGPAGVRTDDAGAFQLLVPAGVPLDLRVQCAGFATGQERVGPQVNEPLVIVLKGGARLEGQLVGGAGERLSGVHGRALLQGHGQRISAVQDGRFRFDGLELGRYILSIEVAGRAAAERVIQVTGELEAVEVSLVDSVVLTGQVWAGGVRSPLAGAAVHWLTDGGQRLSAHSAADGSFEVAVPKGAVGELVAEYGARPKARLALGPLDASLVGLDLVLIEGARLEGHVELGGVAPGEVQVLVVHSPGSLRVTPVRADGSYTLENLPPGGVQVRAFRGELRPYLERQAPWVLQAGQLWPGADLILESGEGATWDPLLVHMPKGKLIRQLDLGFRSGINRVAAVLTAHYSGGTSGAGRTRQTALVPAHGRVTFEWPDLDPGTYDLVLATADRPSIVLHQETLTLEPELLQPPVLELAFGSLELELLGLSADGPEAILLQINQVGRPTIHIRARDQRLLIPGLIAGAAHIQAHKAGQMLAEGTAQIAPGAPAARVLLDVSANP